MLEAWFTKGSNLFSTYNMLAACRKWIDSRNRIAQFKYTRSKLEMEEKFERWVYRRSLRTMVEILPPGSMKRKKDISAKLNYDERAEDRFAEKKTINYFNTISTRNFDILPGQLSFIIHFKEKSKVTGIFTPGDGNRYYAWHDECS